MGEEIEAASYEAMTAAGDENDPVIVESGDSDSTPDFYEDGVTKIDKSTPTFKAFLALRKRHKSEIKWLDRLDARLAEIERFCGKNSGVTIHEFQSCDLPPDFDWEQFVIGGGNSWLNSICHLSREFKLTHKERILRAYKGRFRFHRMYKPRLRQLRKEMWAKNRVVRERILEETAAQLNAFDEAFGPFSNYPDSDPDSENLAVGGIPDTSGLAACPADFLDFPFPSEFGGIMLHDTELTEATVWKARSQGDLTHAQVDNHSLRDLYPDIYPVLDAANQGHGGTENFQKIVFSNGKRRKVVEYQHTEAVTVGDPMVDLDLHEEAGVPHTELVLPSSDSLQGLADHLREIADTIRNINGEIIETFI